MDGQPRVETSDGMEYSASCRISARLRVSYDNRKLAARLPPRDWRHFAGGPVSSGWDKLPTPPGESGFPRTDLRRRLYGWSDRIDFANLIWQIADLLRGPYRPPQYERVMLPMTVLRRFDCVLAPIKAKV